MLRRTARILALLVVCCTHQHANAFSAVRLLPTNSHSPSVFRELASPRCQHGYRFQTTQKGRSAQTLCLSRRVHAQINDAQGPSILQAPLQLTKALLLSALLLGSQPALSVDTSPSVASSTPTSTAPCVVDEARVFGSNERAKLENNLQSFQKQTDYKIRVLTRDPRGKRESMSSQQLKQMWSLPDPKSVVVILDASKGNVLNFNSGDKVAKLLPDRFFNELTGRLGNLYAVRDQGENGVVQEAVEKIELCLVREKGCYVVPGIGKDQYSLSLTASCAGGIVFGASLLTATQFREKNAKGSDAIFKFAPVLFSPLWVLFFGGLGLNPLLQRAVDSSLLAQNIGAFGVASLGMYLAYPVMMRLWGGYM